MMGLFHGYFALCVLPLWVGLSAGASQLARIHVSPETGLFQDDLGRTRLFRGINSVVKSHPWYDVHMTEQRKVDQLADLGFNVIRLGTMWTGVQPEGPDAFNHTYVDVLKGLVESFSDVGMYTLLDMHQDVLWEAGPPEASEGYWGVPPWVKASIPPRGEHPYPWPLKQVLPWPCGYFTPEISQGFQNIFDNSNRTSERLADFWQFIASTFKDQTGVLGYELINEPFGGDIYSDASYLLPGVAGRRNLEPLYNQLHAAIRVVDDETLVFWEPVTWAYTIPGDASGLGEDTLENFMRNLTMLDLLDPLASVCGEMQDGVGDGAGLLSRLQAAVQDLLAMAQTSLAPLADQTRLLSDKAAKPSVFGPGLSSVPGGSAYLNRTVLSWHYYCWAWGEGAIGDKPYDPLTREACDDFLGPLEFRTVQSRADELGGSGTMLTEFGLCYPNITVPDSMGFVECNFVISSAEQQFESWIYWDTAPGNEVLWDEQGNVIPERAATFSRPYPRAIDGRPTRLEFDILTRVFVLEFESTLRDGVDTEIFIPSLHYPEQRFTVSLSDELEWDFDPNERNIILVSGVPTPTSEKAPGTYSIRITPHLDPMGGSWSGTD